MSLKFLDSRLFILIMIHNIILMLRESSMHPVAINNHGNDDSDCTITKYAYVLLWMFMT